MTAKKDVVADLGGMSVEIRETMPAAAQKDGCTALLEGQDFSNLNMLLTQIKNQGSQKEIAEKKKA